MAEYIELDSALRVTHIMRPEDEDLKSAISNIPAADVSPVVHGKWYGNDCTVCKLPWNYNMVQDADDLGYFDPMPEYCPNCGARMDGGDNDAAN